MATSDAVGHARQDIPLKGDGNGEVQMSDEDAAYESLIAQADAYESAAIEAAQDDREDEDEEA